MRSRFPFKYTQPTEDSRRASRDGAGSRCRDAERNEPHDEQARSELKVHIAARCNEAALAEDRDRFYRLLQREHGAEVREPPREATVTTPRGDADRACEQHVGHGQDRAEVEADVDERARDMCV